MIAIPNMEMPKNCNKCHWFYECYDEHCTLGKFLLRKYTTDASEEPYILNVQRHPDCPLIEIVRCEECKWFELDVWGELDGIPLIVAHEMCKFWGNGCKTNPNGFCSYGERK